MDSPRYAIDRKIASGGMATVYLGRGPGALGFERPVAIKVVHPHLLDSGSREQRTQAVLDEARISARIHHPNVVAVLDAVVQDDSVMIVMEYVEGLTVAGLIRSAGRAGERVPVDIALRVLGDALAGLHAAHELHDDGRALGVVHRDVSPQNILVGTDGFAKIADFGVFKAAARGERLAPSTETGDLKGKLGYVPPEVYRGEPVTRRADIYAVGVVLWEILAGLRLFDEETHAALMHHVLAGRVPQLATLRDDVPCELDAVLARALALDPAERFATAEELAQALEALPLTAASARSVARHVRAAMDADPVVTPSTLISSLAPTAIDTVEELTPSEYVTPVRTSRPAASRARVLGVALVTAVSVAAALMVALFGASRSSTAAARAPHQAIILEAKASLILHVPVPVPVPVPGSPLPASARARTRAPSPAPAPASQSASPPSGQPFYDPKEL